ncbi:replication-relaxation family protein [Caldibacillus lycopersici]|uniref:Replication-relaxation family protein n=1 Tax=Perspicuibacillus lycopersici TaxID=1325689 RepID=A0AAE3IT07_9BACI|nr:replication-relaxation family protein [Perspicuibacillus lycopersici]MCU9614060.1 replication-relaxation family protein [Perspicuibacillus lycopersici]
MDKRAAKQQRIENILLSLKKFDYLTRKQIQTIHNLKGDRNANRILNDMERYLHSFRHGLEKVYYLSKDGRERVKCDIIRKKTPQVQHFLLRNQLWIHLKCPSTWKNEVRITADKVSIVCDATFICNKAPCFVEVDVSQPMIKNKSKIDRYRKIKELTGQNFHLIWLTELDSRKSKINELMDGLSGHVFTLNEIN